jgi:aryl-alcohol dehydrogenase-like predicted oxidoreductase
MQHALQAGLASGLSATSGIHSSKPNRLPEDHDHIRDLTPSSYVPKAFPDTKLLYKGKHHNVEAPPFVIGGWPWGDKATWHWDASEMGPLKEAWQLCLKRGLNFIDTSQVYGSGESEKICGELFQGLKREDFIIQTKWWVFPLEPNNLLHPVGTPLAALKESLERMKLDYIDVYLVHGPIHPQSIATVAKGLADCVDKGLTRTVGVANYNEKDMLKMKEELAKHDIPLAINQCEYSLLRREPEVSGLLQACKANDIVFQSYSSLAQGRLSGKYDSDNEPPKEYRFSYPMKDVEPTLEMQKRIAEKRGVSVSAVALNYNLVHGISPVVAVRKPEQAEENVQALGWRLSDEEIAELDRVSFEGKSTSLWQQG